MSVKILQIDSSPLGENSVSRKFSAKVVAALVAKHPDAVVVSLQNGVSNVPLLRERLPGRRVLAGMVPFGASRI